MDNITDSFEKLYVQLKLDMYGRVVLIVFALLWWVLILNYLMNQKMYYHPYTIVQCIVGVIMSYYVIQREYYLPFLGNAVFPCDSLESKEPSNAQRTIHVENLPANVNVFYWAAEENDSKEIEENPWLAYKKYANSGITRSSSKGTADLSIREPVKYRVPTGTTLERHVHYRYCIGDGMLSEVRTAFF
jgi:hypothetical protein